MADLKERQIKRMFLLEFLVDIVRPILFNERLLFGIQGSSKPKPSAFYVRTYTFKNSRCHIKRRKRTLGIYRIRRKDGIDETGVDFSRVKFFGKFGKFVRRLIHPEMIS